jgi:membrane dipeptidase
VRVPILLDAHQDCLRRVLDRDDSLGETYGDEQGNIDLWRAGGFNALWMSVWVDPRKYEASDAVERAQNLIGAYWQQMHKYPDVLIPCQTSEQVRAATGRGQIAALLGLEGGAAINNDLSLIAYYRKRGVRYMTLTWRGNLAWAGSSQSSNPKMGLTAFGRQVVREMNRVGMIVDLSHVSDRTFYDALQETSRPVIVSHSNARLLSPNPRNVTDDMLRAIRDNDGVIGVNFAGDFLKVDDSGNLRLRAGPPTVETVLDQIDHIVQVAGIDHVGIGTDYDGGIKPARGLETARGAPKVLDGLRRRGYSEENIRKIAGENFLRVLAANEGPSMAHLELQAPASTPQPRSYR